MENNLQNQPTILHAVKSSKSQITAKIYSGPLPSAEEMARYAAIDEEMPARIMSMAERQAAHRQKMEMTEIYGSLRLRFIGIIVAFIIGMTAIIVGAYCILHGYSVYGLAVVLADLAALAGVFVYGTHKAAEEQNKTKTNRPNDN